MAWFSGKVSLGNFPDLAGAVNKFQESVKNIEKNFDTALGFEEKSESSNNEASGLWSSDRKPLFDPVMAFIGQKSEETDVESSEKLESSDSPPKVKEKEKAETDRSVHSDVKTTVEEDKDAVKVDKNNESSESVERADTVASEACKAEPESETVSAEPFESTFNSVKLSDSPENGQQKDISDVVPSADSDSKEAKPDTVEVDTVEVEVTEAVPAESRDVVDMHETDDEQKTQTEEILEKGSGSPVKSEESSDSQADAGHPPDEPMPSSSHSIIVKETNSAQELMLTTESVLQNDENATRVEVDRPINDGETDAKEDIRLSSATALSSSADSILELEKMKMEMKMMESALQGAARQAQAKADEISKLMNENEQLKAVIEDLKRKSNEAEMESLREECHQRVSTLERKIQMPQIHCAYMFDVYQVYGPSLVQESDFRLNF